MLSKMLKREGKPAGRRHVSTLMARMGIDALYRKPNTSKRHPAHPVYPYLLRNLTIRLYNQNRPHSSLDDKTPDEFYFKICLHCKKQRRC